MQWESGDAIFTPFFSEGSFTSPRLFRSASFFALAHKHFPVNLNWYCPMCPVAPYQLPQRPLCRSLWIAPPGASLRSAITSSPLGSPPTLLGYVFTISGFAMWPDNSVNFLVLLQFALPPTAWAACKLFRFP